MGADRGRLGCLPATPHPKRGLKREAGVPARAVPQGIFGRAGRHGNAAVRHGAGGDAEGLGVGVLERKRGGYGVELSREEKMGEYFKAWIEDRWIGMEGRGVRQ